MARFAICRTELADSALRKSSAVPSRENVPRSSEKTVFKSCTSWQRCNSLRERGAHGTTARRSGTRADGARWSGLHAVARPSLTRLRCANAPGALARPADARFRRARHRRNPNDACPFRQTSSALAIADPRPDSAAPQSLASRHGRHRRLPPPRRCVLCPLERPPPTPRTPRLMSTARRPGGSTPFLFFSREPSIHPSGDDAAETRPPRLTPTCLSPLNTTASTV
jgi:hypothetical protein